MKEIRYAYTNFWPTFGKDDCVYKEFETVLGRLPYRFNRVDPYAEEADFVIRSLFADVRDGHVKGSPLTLLFSGESYDLSHWTYDYSVSMDSQGGRNLYAPLFVFCDSKSYRDTVAEPFDRKFCSFVVSNDRQGLRNVAFKLISERYRAVDSGGRLFNNVGGPVADKMGFIKDYKFNICFENTKKSGYVTEKLYEAFLGYTIPIYYGAEEASKIFNPDAFIDCTGRDGSYLLKRIEELDTNRSLYMEMLGQPVFNDESFIIEKKTQFHNFILDMLKSRFGA